MSGTINVNSCNNGDIAFVRGHLTYARLKTQISGQELQADAQRRMAQHRQPIEKPYTSATVSNAQVIFADQSNPSNPNKTLFEQYIEEKFYTSAQHPEAGWHFTGLNKGKYCPTVGVLEADGKTVTQINLENELATGLDVTLVLRVFATSRNKGVSLDSVIVNEPIKYYNGGQLARVLESRGFVFQPAAAPAEAEPVVNTEPAQVSAPAPSNTPFSAQPQQAQPTAQYQAQPYQPQAATTPVQQTQPVQQAPIPAAPAQQAPAMNPPYQENSAPAGGIAYNPQNRGY